MAGARVSILDESWWMRKCQLLVVGNPGCVFEADAAVAVGGLAGAAGPRRW